MAENRKLKMLSLFSGIGGIDLAAEWTGQIETVAFVEIDKFCQRVLAKHWPGVPIFDDIRGFTAESLRARGIRSVDIVAGGFPCQDISMAGHSAGKRLGIDGPRSGLWSEMHRIICELRPGYALVENVADLLKRGMGRVLSDLAASGYDAEWQVLSPTFVGLPHLRERLFLVAYPSVQRLEGRKFEWPRFRAKAFSEAEVWGLLPGPYIRRAPYGVSERMGRIGGAGNAVVPPLVYPILKAIAEIEVPV